MIIKVREYETGGSPRDEAVKKAVIFCRNHDIIKEFLEENTSEVINMLLTEWNWDDAKEVWHEEGREEGEQKKALEIARKMKEMGDTPERIHVITGLSPACIEHLN